MLCDIYYYIYYCSYTQNTPHPKFSLDIETVGSFIAQKTLKSLHSYIAFNREQGNSYITLKNIS